MQLVKKWILEHFEILMRLIPQIATHNTGFLRTPFLYLPFGRLSGIATRKSQWNIKLRPAIKLGVFINTRKRNY